MADLHRKYAQRGVQIVGVSLDKKPEFLPKYQKKYNVAYPLLVGTRQTQQRWIGSSKTWSIFFVNAKGEIVQHIEKSYQGMEKSVYPWYTEYLLSSGNQPSGKASRAVGKTLDWKAWQQQGARLCQNRQYRDAETAYSKAIVMNPRNARLWNLRGVVRYRLKRYQDAVDDYSKALQLQPELYWPRRNRAESFHRHLKQYTRSIADYDVLLKTHSNVAVLWKGRGCAHFKNRDYRHAIADLTKAIEKDPKDASVLLWRGFAYRKLRQNGKAITDYSAAIKLAPNNHLLWNNRAYAYYYSGRYAEAVADFDQALKLNSKHDGGLMDGESTRIAGACRNFEAELIAGGNPRIEQYLNEVSASDRTALIEELLTIEIEFRLQRGESPRPEDFQHRFPEHAESIAEFLCGSATPLPTAGPREGLAGTAAESVDETWVPERDGATASSMTGERFGGYVLLEEIARGGMGVVYKARQTSLNRIVALKMILSGKLASDADIRRFHAEAEAAAKLDHPNIVPVYEVGELNGQHFFSMGFVEGRSLQEKIADGPLPPREAARLTAKIAAAVQYAHEMGVVHRDLKPANVLLSEGGRPPTVAQTENADARDQQSFPQSTESDQPAVPRITDFGLAKLTDVDTALTATGQIMGTPGYMPPEQAAGRTDNVGPAADIYSTGAMLYSLLTGRPPFQAAGLAETLKYVIEREPVSPAQLNPAVDRDLETICLKCLRKDPAKRYASAAALAADLSLYLDGRPIMARPVSRIEKTRRWCLRNPLAALMILLLVIISIGAPIIAYRQTRLSQQARHESARATQALAAETRAKQEAIENEQRASRNLDRSAEVVKEFVFEIGKEGGPLTQTPGGKPLRMQLLQRARTHYEQLIADNPGAQLTPRLAEAHFDLAFVLAQLSGNKEQAIAEYLRAIDLCRQLADEDPQGAKFQNLLAASHIHLGTLYQTTERPAEALHAYKSAMSLYQQLLRAKPKAAEFRSGLAECHNNIALLSDHTSKAAESMASLKKSQEIYEALVREHPNVAKYQSGLAGSYLNLGVFLHNTGRLDDALDIMKKSSTLFTRLIERFPKSMEYQKHYGDILVNIGGIHRKTGRLDEALTTWRKALTIRLRMARENPKVAEHQTALVMCQNNVGLACTESGDVTGAMKAYNSAIQVQTRLVQDNPTVTTYRSTLASCHNNLGMLYDQSGKTAEAIAAFQQGLRIHTKLSQEHPDVPDFQHGLASSRHGIGLAFQASGNTALAMLNFRQELKIYQRLTSKHPRVTDYQRGLAASLTNIGGAFLKSGSLAKAQESYFQAISLWERLAGDNPGVPEYQNGLANCKCDLAIVFFNNRKWREALKAVQQANTIWEKLVRSNPGNMEYQRGLARGCAILSTLFRNAGKLKLALDASQRALAAQKRLARAYPHMTYYQINLANRHGLSGVLFYRLGEITQASSAFQQALMIFKQIATDNPKTAQHQFNLAVKGHFSLTELYRVTHQPAKALPHLQESIRILQQLHARESTSEKYRSECRDSYITLGIIHRALANHSEAIAAWRQALSLDRGKKRTTIEAQLCRSLADSGEHIEATTLAGRLLKNSRNLTVVYNLGRTFAVSILSARCDRELDSGQRAQLTTRYADTAIEILAALSRAGFFKTEKNRLLAPGSQKPADLCAVERIAMSDSETAQRLSRISTHWTLVAEAHGDRDGQRAMAALVQKYRAAVFRYLLGAIRDANAAEELCQEFLLRFLSGNFHRADPKRGRFRNYLKTALINLVNDYRAESAKAPRAMGSRAPEPVAPHDDDADSGANFVLTWREELLEQTWAALRKSREKYFEVLRLRVHSPEATSRELAEQLTQSGVPMTAANVRKVAQRAQAKFAELLVEEVVSTMDEPDAELLNAELQELDLLKYCRTAAEKWSGSAG
eukprot:g8264.t1